MLARYPYRDRLFLPNSRHIELTHLRRSLEVTQVNNVRLPNSVVCARTTDANNRSLGQDQTFSLTSVGRWSSKDPPTQGAAIIVLRFERRITATSTYSYVWFSRSMMTQGAEVPELRDRQGHPPLAWPARVRLPGFPMPERA